MFVKYNTNVRVHKTLGYFPKLRDPLWAMKHLDFMQLLGLASVLWHLFLLTFVITRFLVFGGIML